MADSEARLRKGASKSQESPKPEEEIRNGGGVDTSENYASDMEEFAKQRPDRP